MSASSRQHRQQATRPSRADLLALLNPIALYRQRPPRPGDPTPEQLLGKGVRFVQRIYLMRIVGMGFGFFCVAGAFIQHPVAWPLWVLLVFQGFVWPHLASAWALRSAIPYRAERRNLVIDTALGGLWVAAMQGNLVPCAVLVAMLSINNMAAGGMRLFMRGLYASLASFLLGWILLRSTFFPATDVAATLASLPMLLLYPLALGITTYNLSKKLAERSREFELVSQTDGLTGLYNRRYWENLLVAEFEHCQHSGRSAYTACLLLLDLDHFKRVNDTHGHLAGDEVLRNFAALLRNNLRTEDAIGRYGGEEFVVILRDTTMADAYPLSERLLAQVRLQQGDPAFLRGCTISAGLVAFSPELATHEIWLQRADQAMYRAKDQGRDCLVTAGMEVKQDAMNLVSP